MKSRLFAFILLLLLQFNTKAQSSNKIENIATIEIINDENVSIQGDTISLNNIHKKVRKVLSSLSMDANSFPSLTLIVNQTVSENTIENIKYQIRSTPVQLINLQRNTINTYDGIEVTQNILDQYNALISYWNSLDAGYRYYRASDLEFVKSVALNMTMNQRIRNGKLPGYLPFVKAEPVFPDLYMLEALPNQTYIFIRQKDTLDKDTAFKNFENKSYRLKRRIIDEQDIVIIDILKD
jgi:hypothetical protein